MNTPPRNGGERVSYRSPESAKIKITPKIQEIYNSLANYKKSLNEPEQLRDIYTPDILIKILEKKSQKPLNHEIFTELIERVKKNSRGEFNINDWIRTYIEAEDILNAKIDRQRLRIGDLEQEETQLQSWLEAEHSQLTSSGTGRNQKALWINVLDGEVVNEQQRANFKAPPYVKIQYGRDQLQSKPAENLNRPVWNKSFKIPLNPQETTITISVFDVHSHQYGSLKLNVQNFEDQKKRKQWIYLSSNKTDGLTAKLNVSVVVLYSELERIQDEISEKETAINEANNDLVEFQKMLADLYVPFENLGFGEFRTSALNQSGRPSIFAPEVKVGKTEKELMEKLTNATGRYISNWIKFYYIVSIIVVILSLLCNFVRISFIDIVVIIFIYAESIRETLTQTRMRIGLGLGVLSLVYDFIWAFGNSRDWCSTFHQNAGCELLNFIVWVTWILIIAKIIWCISLWRNSAAFDDYQEKAQLLLNQRRVTTGLRDHRMQP